MADRNSFRRDFNNNQSDSISLTIGKWISNKIISLADATGKTTVSMKGLMKKVGLAFATITGGSFGRDFDAPDFDMQQIQNAYEADGYVRQAIDKYVDLIFKTGYEITGVNPKAVEYIKARLAYIAEATTIPTEIFFQEIAENLIKFNNVIIAKGRTTEKAVLPLGTQPKGMDGLDPIGGYFLLPVQTMKVKRDKFGVIKGWEQEVEGQDKTAKFKIDDILHIYFKREPGKAFAYPSLLSVIDDVRALREIEDRVLHMLYRNVNPLLHVKVGLKETPGQSAEVTEAEELINGMSVDGGIVTTERVNVDSIATKNAVDAEPFLKHFEKRVFTGLGVSETMMGRGDTSNRSTSASQKEEAVDRVKAFQRIITIFVNFGIINELLREGGFDPLNKIEDVVILAFKDPDVDSKIKQEAHAIYKFTSNAITELEMRKAMNSDPIPDADRALLYYNLYKGVESATTAQTSNTVKPENQFGKKTSPKKETNSIDILFVEYSDTYRKDLMANTDAYYTTNTSNTNNTIDILNNTNYYRDAIQSIFNLEDNVLESSFTKLYEEISKSLLEFKTSQVAKETISAIIDVFIEEVNYILDLRKEEYINE